MGLSNTSGVISSAARDSLRNQGTIAHRLSQNALASRCSQEEGVPGPKFGKYLPGLLGLRVHGSTFQALGSLMYRTVV